MKRVYKGTLGELGCLVPTKTLINCFLESQQRQFHCHHEHRTL